MPLYKTTVAPLIEPTAPDTIVSVIVSPDWRYVPLFPDRTPHVTVSPAVLVLETVNVVAEALYNADPFPSYFPTDAVPPTLAPETTIFRLAKLILEADTLETVTTQLVDDDWELVNPALFAVPGEWVNPLTITYRTAARTTVIATINMVAMTGDTPLSLSLLAIFFVFILFRPAPMGRRRFPCTHLKGLFDKCQMLIL